VLRFYLHMRYTFVRNIARNIHLSQIITNIYIFDKILNIMKNNNRISSLKKLSQDLGATNINIFSSFI
jgi:hypothetical protein